MFLGRSFRHDRGIRLPLFTMQVVDLVKGVDLYEHSSTASILDGILDVHKAYQRNSNSFILKDFSGLAGPVYLLSDKNACGSPAFHSSLQVMHRATYRQTAGDGEGIDPASRIGVSHAPVFWAVIDPRQERSRMQRKGPRVSLLPRTAAFSPTSLHGSLRGVGGIARSILPCMRFALGTFKKDDIVSVEDAASCLVLTVNLIAHLIRNHAPTQREALEKNILVFWGQRWRTLTAVFWRGRKGNIKCD